MLRKDSGVCADMKCSSMSLSDMTKQSMTLGHFSRQVTTFGEEQTEAGGEDEKADG